MIFWLNDLRSGVAAFASGRTNPNLVRSAQFNALRPIEQDWARAATRQRLRQVLPQRFGFTFGAPGFTIRAVFIIAETTWDLRAAVVIPSRRRECPWQGSARSAPLSRPEREAAPAAGFAAVFAVVPLLMCLRPPSSAGMGAMHGCPRRGEPPSREGDC